MRTGCLLREPTHRCRRDAIACAAVPWRLLIAFVVAFAICGASLAASAIFAAPRSALAESVGGTGSAGEASAAVASATSTQIMDGGRIGAAIAARWSTVSGVLSSVGDAADGGEVVKVYVPLVYTIDDSRLIENDQGTSGYWGACGECACANTLNVVLGTSYTETDIVELCMENGWCDPDTAGMDVNGMVSVYASLLPDGIGVNGYAGTYAPDMETIASKLDQGMVLDVTVYGEMQREGGHTGEGDVYSDHWLTLTGCTRDASGAVTGFDIIDSSSDARYIAVEDLADIYYGHDGTTILDPTCIQIYGWEYAIR